MDLNGNLASILTLISAVTAATVSIITAIRASRKEAVAGQKLDRIEGQTNGTLNRLKTENEALKAENHRLDIANSRLAGDRRNRVSSRKSKPKKNGNGGSTK
jgi:hypothetical protein